MRNTPSSDWPGRLLLNDVRTTKRSAARVASGGSSTAAWEPGACNVKLPLVGLALIRLATTTPFKKGTEAFARIATGSKTVGNSMMVISLPIAAAS